MNEYWDAWTRVMFSITILEAEGNISFGTLERLQDELMTLKTLILEGKTSESNND